MKEFNQEVKVGLLLLVTLVILAYFAVKVGSFKLPWEKQGYSIVVYFDNIAGLEEKAPVRLAGVRIGQVTSITLEKGKARVVAEIYPDIVIQKDATVNVSQMGVMGEKYLEIIRGSYNAPVLKEGDVLTGLPPTSFDQVISVVNSIGHDIKAMTASFRKSLAGKEGEERLTIIMENIQQITSTLSETLMMNQKNINTTMDNLRQLSENMNGMVDSNRDNIRGLMENLDTLSRTLAEKTPSLMDRLDSLAQQISKALPDNNEDVEHALKNIAQATDDLRGTVSAMRDIVERVQQGEGTVGKLLTDDQTHRNLNAALTNLEETLDEAKNVLGRVSLYETSLGYRAEFLGESENWKHFISLKIKPREDKYYLLEIVDSPYGNPVHTTTHTFVTTHSSVSGDEYVETTTEETKIKDEFLINVQVAKEFNNLTFRAGLIETHGGVGVDWSVWRKKLVFSAEGWDFGRDELNFHMKLSARLAVYPGIYLFGGWDDSLNQDIDSYFVGAGVLFTDEDLKYLLGLAATASSSL